MKTRSLIKTYEQSFRDHGELPALTDYFKGESFTYMEMAQEIARLHLLFDEAHIAQGDRIALVGRNNPRWCMTYIAVITYGAVIVPILQDFTPNDINHILHHSGARLIFCGDTFWDDIDAEASPDLTAAFSLTDFHCIWERGDGRLDRYRRSILRHFRNRYPGGFDARHIVYPDLPGERMIILNYTSGTTGFSKGVMLTHDNLTGNIVRFGLEQHLFDTDSRTLAFLPLAHAYGCAFDLLLPLAAGAHITLLGRTPSPKILIEAMGKVRPQIICCVPLILEKVYRKQIQPLLAKTPVRLALKLPLIDTALYAMIRRRLLDAFGGQVVQFIVGGAPMNAETEEFLHRIDFPFTVGYGMTECGPLITYAPWREFVAGSCGRPLQFMEVRIDSPDPLHTPGEILTRGMNVMPGYYKNPEATAQVLDADGWLHTGDIGTLDAGGNLFIRGRSKTMILGPSGQNIYPEEIEAKLNNLYCVMESLVVEREGRLTALVVPDYEQADADGIAHDRLERIMQDNLKELNSLLAPYEQVASVVLYPTEFEKTPKRSIRRYLYTA